jgi:hypothetical protein
MFRIVSQGAKPYISVQMKFSERVEGDALFKRTPRTHSMEAVRRAGAIQLAISRDARHNNVDITTRKEAHEGKIVFEIPHLGDWLFGLLFGRGGLKYYWETFPLRPSNIKVTFPPLYRRKSSLGGEDMQKE